jgi:hypothetical protein
MYILKYSLRSLMIVAILAPQFLEVGWFVLQRIQADAPTPRRHFLKPHYKDPRALRIMMKEEQEHGSLKAIGN